MNTNDLTRRQRLRQMASSMPYDVSKIANPIHAFDFPEEELKEISSVMVQEIQSKQ